MREGEPVPQKIKSINTQRGTATVALQQDRTGRVTDSTITGCILKPAFTNCPATGTRPDHQATRHPSDQTPGHAYVTRRSPSNPVLTCLDLI